MLWTVLVRLISRMKRLRGVLWYNGLLALIRSTVRTSRELLICLILRDGLRWRLLNLKVRRLFLSVVMVSSLIRRRCGRMRWFSEFGLR